MAETISGFDSTTDFLNPRIEKWHFRFLCFNQFMFFLSAVMSSVGFFTHGNKIFAILAGFSIVISVALISYKFLVINVKTQFEGCLRWCDTWHSRNLYLSSIKEIFDVCGDKSIKIFDKSVIYMPALMLGVMFSETVVVSCVTGKFSQFAPFMTFSVEDNSMVYTFPAWVNQVVFAFDSFVVECLFFGIAIVTITHILAVLEGMEIILRELNTSICPKKFKALVGIVIDWHAEIIERQQILSKITAWPILIFEMFAYGSFLMTWTVCKFDPSQCILGLGCFVYAIANFILIFMSEKLAEAYENVKETLYGLEWYNMKPQQRKLFILTIKMLDRPILLRAGPLHPMTFEEMGVFLNRIYSCAIAVNRFISE